MNRYTGLCLSIVFGSALLTGCTGTTMPVLYGEQQGPNGQRMLMSLAAPGNHAGMSQADRALQVPTGAPTPAASMISVVPEALPFLAPASLRMVASSQGAIEIHNDGVAAESGTAALTGSELFTSLSPTMQALLFPSCSAEHVPAQLAVSR